MKTLKRFFDFPMIISTLIWTGVTIFFYVMIVKDFRNGCYIGDSLVQFLSISLLVVFSLVLIFMYVKTIQQTISDYRWYRHYKLTSV